MIWRNWHHNFYHAFGEDVFHVYNLACKYLHICEGNNKTDLTPLFIERSGKHYSSWYIRLPGTFSLLWTISAISFLLLTSRYVNIGQTSFQQQTQRSGAFSRLRAITCRTQIWKTRWRNLFLCILTSDCAFACLHCSEMLHQLYYGLCSHIDWQSKLCYR